MSWGFWVHGAAVSLGLLGAGAALVACGSDAPAPPTTCPGSAALWVASDYSSSAVGALTTDGGVWAVAPVANLGKDPGLAVSRGRDFYVARDLDTIFTLDPQCGTPVQAINVHQPTYAGSANPQDVAVAKDGTLWVPLYNVPSLVVLSPSGAVLHTIDLSSYDGDGNPQAMGVVIADTPTGEKAFVALQRLNDQTYVSEQPSWMLRVDVATATVEATIVLEGRNPFEIREDEDGGVLWLAEPGNFDDATETEAGVERFQTTDSTTALVAREPDLGGSVADVAVTDGCGAAIVADSTVANATSLVTFDPDAGTVLAPASASPLATTGPDGGFFLQSLVWLGGELHVGDRRRAANGYPLHAMRNTGGCTLTFDADRVNLPLPPVAVRPPR